MLERRYDGNLHIGKMDAQFQDFRDIPASADAELQPVARPGADTVVEADVAEVVGRDEREHRRFQAIPRVQSRTAARSTWRRWAEIARVRGVRAGGANVSGSGTFSQDNFATSGKLTLRGVNYEDPSLALARCQRRVPSTRVDREHILLKKIDARLLGGTVTGNAEVRH